MRGLILILLASLASLASLANAEQSQQVIDVQHDSHRQVTCWIIAGTGISCLPDSQLRQPVQATKEPAACAKSQVSTTVTRQHHEKVQL
ncbi:hypothetical protein [Pseudomonas abietaniphila]|uniref:hypothetical protein n=1 Tax=Pseudomonas abietaniphila TaxID=89065 RepID=UPI0007805D75|nr:hypothetical protein [Pseudomonas abietaniphila]